MRSKKPLNRFSELELLRVASGVCALSPRNVLVIGGGMILPEIIGFDRLRMRSDDLDFVVNDEGYSDLSDVVDLSLVSLVKEDEEDPYLKHTFVDGVNVAFFHNGIRGYDIIGSDFESAVEKDTSQGRIYMIGPELNMALKIRRGASKTHVYSKDGLDFASIIVGMSENGETFDFNAFRDYMQRGVCESCALYSETLCLEQLGSGAHNLRSAYEDTFSNALAECKTLLKDSCKYS